MAVFYIDGVAQASLNFTKGSIYRFDQSNASNASDILLLSLVEDGENNLQVPAEQRIPYELGVTYWINNAEVGLSQYLNLFSTAPSRFFQIEVDASAPALLYYYSPGTTSMGGIINVS